MANNNNDGDKAIQNFVTWFVLIAVAIVISALIYRAVRWIVGI